MPVTCETSHAIREIHSKSNQRKKWSGCLSITDSTPKAQDASTGTGGLMLPNKLKRSLRHHTPKTCTLSSPFLSSFLIVLIAFTFILTRVCMYVYTHKYISKFHSTNIPKSTGIQRFLCA